MRFELLRQRVERAELRVAGCLDQAHAHRHRFGLVWRHSWSPARIVVAGLLSGFLVGRAEPLSRIGGMRWLQMLGTVSSLLTTLQAASAAEEAAQGADAAADAADAAQQAASGQPAAAPGATAARAEPAGPLHPPSPAEAATEMSER